MPETVYRHLEISQQIALQRQYLQNMEAQLFQCDQDEDAARGMLDSGDQELRGPGEGLLKQAAGRRKQIAVARASGEKKLEELTRFAQRAERAKATKAERRNGHAPVPVKA